MGAGSNGIISDDLEWLLTRLTSRISKKKRCRTQLNLTTSMPSSILGKSSPCTTRELHCEWSCDLVTSVQWSIYYYCRLVLSCSVVQNCQVDICQAVDRAAVRIFICQHLYKYASGSSFFISWTLRVLYATTFINLRLYLTTMNCCADWIIVVDQHTVQLSTNRPKTRHWNHFLISCGRYAVMRLR